MKVWQLLSSRKRWTRGAFATDEFGNPTPIADPTATSWCLAGAIRKCYDRGPIRTEEYYGVNALVQKAIKKVSRGRFGTVCGWNDSSRRTFDQVKALVKKLDV